MSQDGDNFIGKFFNQGRLKVIGVAGRIPAPSYIKLYKVKCMECNKDKELFPLDYFVSTKGSLKRGGIPCACSRSYKWDERQYLIKANRAALEKEIVVCGLAEGYKGSKTKIACYCIKHEHTWNTRLEHLINTKIGCVFCAAEINAVNLKNDIKKVYKLCDLIAKEKGYTFLGFIDGYSSVQSKIKYSCPFHGEKATTYHSFVLSKKHCNKCAIEHRMENNGVFGYYPKRKEEQDFLYILDFDGKYIKVGRSFDLQRRIPELEALSKLPVKIIASYTAKHEDIFNLEQYVVAELKSRGFRFRPSGWNSQETFDNDSLYFINKTLTDLKEVSVNDNWREYSVYTYWK